MFNVLGFGFAFAVLLVSFGKLITDSWFAYMMISIIHFEVLIFWFGCGRPSGETENTNADYDYAFSETTPKKRTKPPQK